MASVVFHRLPLTRIRATNGAMLRITFRRVAIAVWFAVVAASPVHSVPAAPPDGPPNIVLIFCDDLGYADLGCFGSKICPTPNLDRMAAEGIRFTDFYVPQAVCSASRAALLTGCYPNRVGIQGALGPRSKVGLHPNEVTVAEVLKPRGYATAIFGKWHLGDQREFLPTRQGFDEYFGLPYSNDMWPLHPEYVNLPPDAAKRKRGYPDLPLVENEKVLIPKVAAEHQSRLTTGYAEHAVDFIGRNKGRPFFLYLAHNMPHVPLFVSEKHRGKSGNGLYADVLMEIDWSVGQVLGALKQHGLDERTLVVFTSDNGPWLLYGDHAGSAGHLREGKGTEFDGGVRVPFIARWPGRIPAGATCREPAMTIDLLPTFAGLAGAEPPRDRIIDGRDIWNLISGQPRARSPQEAYFFYWGRHLQAVRSGQWKLHLPHGYPVPAPPGSGGQPGKYQQREIALALFDLEQDPGETVNVADEHPRIVERLKNLAERCREDLGDSAKNAIGKNVRAAGQVEKPRLLSDPE
jgi:arylsulfatase A-like enzyme